MSTKQIVLFLILVVAINAQLLSQSYLGSDCSGENPPYEEKYYVTGKCFKNIDGGSIKAMCEDGRASISVCGGDTCSGLCITSSVDSGKCSPIIGTSRKFTCGAGRPYGNRGDTEVTEYAEAGCQGEVQSYTVSSGACLKGQSTSQRDTCIRENGRDARYSQVWTSSTQCPSDTKPACRYTVRTDACNNANGASSKLTGCGAHTYFLSLIIIVVSIAFYLL